ncbi:MULTISPECIES: hypothetical protein [unclassified Microbacterium]|uniref:hypothetical protein n=1 Tax=unclassified Microbacterium TaxID=2609290 RepID=UPI003C2E2F38
MVRTIDQLRAASDEELIAEHDRHAKHTSVGTGYYMEELDRRSRERSTEAANRLAAESHRLAKQSQRLAVASTVLSAIATMAAILALFLR